MAVIPDWARAYGPPLFPCHIRTAPEDFIVDEILDIATSGDGEHDWLRIRKTGANTAWVAERLAKFAGVPVRDVGYAGLKDRHAVTTQWFSVRRPARSSCNWAAFNAHGVEVLEAQRHSRKLKRGAHSGNEFRIVLRDVDAGADSDDLGERVDCIAAGGAPNYFGEQRFGRAGSNIELGEAVIAGKRTSRNKRSMGISALRSLHFNRELDARVRDGTWNNLLPGDVANLDGTNSVFEVDEMTNELEQRCRELDLHPTGTMPAIEPLGIEASRRPLRMRVHELRTEHGNGLIRLNFRLDRGCFATVVLRELCRAGNRSHRI